jgi:hypothetical protein
MTSSAQNSTGNTSGNAIFWTSEHMVTSEHIFWTSKLQNMPPTAFICRSDQQSPQPPNWICLDLAPCFKGLQSQLQDVSQLPLLPSSPPCQRWRCRHQDPRWSWGWRWVVRRGRRGGGGEREERAVVSKPQPRAHGIRSSSSRIDEQYNAVGTASSASEHGPRPSSRETTRPPSPSHDGVFSTKTTAKRRTQKTRCTCPRIVYIKPRRPCWRQPSWSS